MRNPDRIDPILELVKKIWVKAPDLRFAQLFTLVQHRVQERMHRDDWFYIEDEIVLQVLEDILKDKLG